MESLLDHISRREHVDVDEASVPWLLQKIDTAPTLYTKSNEHFNVFSFLFVLPMI